MEKINETIKEKRDILEDYYDKIEAIKNEIRDIRRKKYLMCDHKFQLYPIYSGPILNANIYVLIVVIELSIWFKYYSAELARFISFL